MTKKKLHYYRIIRISFDLFEQWLNLPDGFTVEAIQQDSINRVYELRLICPHGKQFEIKEGQGIPTAMAVGHSNPYGFLVALWHPDLGQKEPKNRVKRIKDL